MSRVHGELFFGLVAADGSRLLCGVRIQEEQLVLDVAHEVESVVRTATDDAYRLGKLEALLKKYKKLNFKTR